MWRCFRPRRRQPAASSSGPAQESSEPGLHDSHAQPEKVQEAGSHTNLLESFHSLSARSSGPAPESSEPELHDSHAQPREVQEAGSHTNLLESFHSLSARSLNITWGDDLRYWEWVRHEGSRFEEVAHLKMVCWLDASGTMSCNLQPGRYTFSWRLHMDLTESHGWDVGKPVLFQFATSDGQSGSHASQNLMLDTGESRHTGMGWRELDVGELVVSPDSQPPLRITFFMKETETNAWKGGLFLDGVVVQKSSQLERT